MTPWNVSSSSYSKFIFLFFSQIWQSFFLISLFFFSSKDNYGLFFSTIVYEYNTRNVLKSNRQYFRNTFCPFFPANLCKCLLVSIFDRKYFFGRLDIQNGKTTWGTPERCFTVVQENYYVDWTLICWCYNVIGMALVSI